MVRNDARDWKRVAVGTVVDSVKSAVEIAVVSPWKLAADSAAAVSDKNAAVITVATLHNRVAGRIVALLARSAVEIAAVKMCIYKHFLLLTMRICIIHKLVIFAN